MNKGAASYLPSPWGKGRGWGSEAEGRASTLAWNPHLQPLPAGEGSHRFVAAHMGITRDWKRGVDRAEVLP